MSILDKRVCEEDINRVNAVRHHPKYEPGFEHECREERVWYLRGENGLPVGYFMFEDVQEQFDKWQEKKLGQRVIREQNNMRDEAGGQKVVAGGQNGGAVNKEQRVKKHTLFDKIIDQLLEYAGMK